MSNEIKEVTIQFENMIQAHQLEWNISIGVFVLGVLLFAYLVKKENELNLQETILAVVGLKKITRTWTIAIVNILTIVLPLTIIVFTFYP